MLCYRKYCLRMMVVLCFVLVVMPLTGWGQTRATKTVYDGTDQNRYFPIYAYYADDAQHTQFFMPASDLSALNGAKITSLTFYSTGTSSWTSTGTFTMKLNNSLSTTSVGTNFINTSTWTTYFTGTVTINSDGTMTIPVSGNFTYNSDNPLWIDFQLPDDDKNYTNVYFYGQNKSSATGLYYNSTSISEGGSGYSVSFLPKTTFTYTTSSVSAPTISTKTVTNITYNAATSGGESISGSSITEKGLVWRTSSGVTTSNYNASGVNGGKSSDGTGTSSFNHTMVGLSPGVTYYVKAYATNSGGTSYGTERFFTPTAANIYNRLTYDSGTDGNGSEDAENLFDQDQTTKWCVINFSSANVIFHSSEPIKPVGYRMKTANDNASEHGRNPKTWTLYGGTSASGSWTPIATVSNNYYMQDVNYTYYTFGTDVSNTAYNYFKLEITGISSGSVMQISEFDFLVPSYNITIGSHTGGSLITSPSGSAIPGETVTVTATPNSGYQLTALTYNDGSDHSISISSTPYTFTMPSANVTLNATYSQQSSPATLPYTCNFEDTSENGKWQVGNSTDGWFVGTATYSSSNHSIYVSSDNGSTNTYVQDYAYIYAYRAINFTEEGSYVVSYKWKCQGEGSNDYLRAFLVPQSCNPTLTGGTSNGIGTSGAPSNWIPVDNGHMDVNGSSWTQVEKSVSVSSAGTYYLVFHWRTDSSWNGNDHSSQNPPAAVDDVSVKRAYPLTFAVNLSGSGTVSATYNNTSVSSGTAFLPSTVINITATPATGYIFNGWTVSGTGASLSNANARSTTLTTGSANMTLTANFIPWTVSVATSPASTECLTSGTSVTMTASHDIPFEYAFTKTSSTFSSISDSPNGTYSTTGDGSTYQVSLPFAFNLAGKDFEANTILYMRCDGHVSFGSSWSDHYASSPGTLRSVIAVLGYDQYLDGDAKMYYKEATEGGVQVLILEWNYMRSYNSSYNRASYQVKLYQGSNIVKMCYGSFSYGTTYTMYTYITADGNMTEVTSSYANPVIETNTTAATTGISVSSAALAPASGTVYTFTPPQITYAWTYSGTSGTASGNVYTASPTTNSTYRVNVTYNGSTKSENVNVTVTPATPTGLTASDITSTSATVAWTANGATSWKYSINNGSTWTNVNTNSVNLTGLTPGQSYPFQVKAVSGSCESSVGSCTVTTLNTFTLTYNSNGGSGTMTDPDSPYNNGSTVTVLANSFTRTGYVFNCWNTAADGSGTKYVAGDTFTITANTTLYAQWAPLVIANTTQWNEFAAAVNSGFTYNGLTVTMTADVGTVTRMVGTSSNVFRGTFNGQCRTLDVNITSEAEFCGPFCYTYGATIENLKVTGTINTSHKHTGGVVGRTGTGKLTLTNVLSSVTINSSISGSGEQGGLVGYAINGEFKGCAFTGKLLGHVKERNNRRNIQFQSSFCSGKQRQNNVGK